MRVLAISNQSMVAIRRLNREAEGARLKEAVLGIFVPLLRYSRSLHQFLNRMLGMPDASNNHLFA
jgi:hypothetical protein